jgi:hypothetical protein
MMGVDESQNFNNLINELMRMNYHANANTNGAKKGLGGATKERANSEKQGTY